MEDDVARVSQLLSYEIMFSEHELLFDQTAKIVRDAFKAEYAGIKFLDCTVNWTKAGTSCDMNTTLPRSQTLCWDALNQDGILVILDISKDDRYKSHPVVVNCPHLRFYAGIPIVNKAGYPLGVVCVLDSKARSDFSEKDREFLKNTSKMVMNALENRKTATAYRKETEKSIADEENRSLIFANTSHDIRSPLTSMMGIIECLLMSDHLKKYFIEDISILKSSCMTLHQLTSNILDLSKLEAIKVVLENIQFDLDEVMCEIAVEFTPLLKDYSINFIMIPEKQNNDDVSGNFIKADPTRLKQIFTSILTSISVANVKGDVEMSYFVNTKHVPTILSVEIKSTVPWPSDLISSKHLCLNIAMKLINLMHGEVQVIQCESGVSVLSILIPVDQVLSQGQLEPCLSPLRRLNIILAEDNPAIQKIMKRFVNSLGHDLRVCENGKIALEVMRTLDFDLFLCDKHMPEMGGEETISNIRSDVTHRHFQKPIYLFTADTDALSQATMTTLQISGVLSKPISFKALKRFIDHLPL